MPLIKSKSEPAFKENVRTLMGEIGKSPHVKNRKQALAIAYETQRRGRKKGGRIHFQMGGFANPNAAPVTGPPMPTAGLGIASPPPPSPANYSPPPAQTGPQPQAPQPPQNHFDMGTGMLGGFQWPAQLAPYMAAAAPQMGTLGNALTQAGMPGFGQGWFQGAGTGMVGGMPSKDGGGIQGLALGGPPMPWFSRQEARNLTHVGPVNSIVPGRTDRHNVNVPSGAYVLPAATISHLGQSNTNAGMAVAHRMFGSGPGGMPTMKMGHGAGLPRPPKPMGIRSDRGGARGHDVGQPTPVVVAGGEYIIDPAKVAEIGGGSVEMGHKILDEFVKRIHKKHAKEIASLPPPAKS